MGVKARHQAERASGKGRPGPLPDAGGLSFPSAGRARETFSLYPFLFNLRPQCGGKLYSLARERFRRPRLMGADGELLCVCVCVCGWGVWVWVWM